MRKAFRVQLPAGQTWPQSEQGGAETLGPFSWIRVHNRGAADVVYDFSNPIARDAAGYFEVVRAGRRLVRNLAGMRPGEQDDELPTELYILNIDPANAATLMVEVSDSPIVDFTDAASQVLQTPADATATPADALDTRTWVELFNGATSDRWRSVGAAGDGLGVGLAMQPSSTPQSANAVNANVSTSYAAVAGQRHRLTLLTVGFIGPSTVATFLNILDGATVVFSVGIPVGTQALSIPLPSGGIQGSVNSTVAITLGAGGAGITGYLNTAKLTG